MARPISVPRFSAHTSETVFGTIIGRSIPLRRSSTSRISRFPVSGLNHHSLRVLFVLGVSFSPVSGCRFCSSAENTARIHLAKLHADVLERLPLEQAHPVRVIGRYAEVLGEVFGRSAAPGAGRELFMTNHNVNRPCEWPNCPAQMCGLLYRPKLSKRG